MEKIIVYGQQDSPLQLRERLIDYLIEREQSKIWFIVMGTRHYDRHLDGPIFKDIEHILNSYDCELFLMRNDDDPMLFPYFAYSRIKFIGSVAQFGPILLIPGYVPLHEVKVDHKMYREMALDLNRALKHAQESRNYDDIGIVVAGTFPATVPPVSIRDDLVDFLDQQSVDEYIQFRNNMTFIYEQLRKSNSVVFWCSPHYKNRTVVENSTEFHFINKKGEFTF